MALNKKLLSIVVLTVVALCSVGQAHAIKKGEKAFGLRTGYVSRNNSADLGLFFQYTFSKWIRIQPGADIVFRHNNKSAFTADLNVHVPVGFEDDNFTLYPLAGLNFSSWNRSFPRIAPDLNPDEEQPGEFPEITDLGETSKRTNRFGFNLGAGFDMKINSKLRFSIEVEYTFVVSHSGVRALAGINYIF